MEAVWAIEEVYVDKFYDSLSGCKTMLDIWWYLWESALFLSQKNNKVIVYEIDKNNFKYINKNTSWVRNIDSYNLAVVGDKNKDTVVFSSSHEHAMDWGIMLEGKILNPSITYEVETAYIWDIIKEHHPDGIKIDIEWGEYEIIDELIDSNIFFFKKGLIEFHVWEEKKEELIIKFTNFIKFLDNKWYSYTVTDAITKKTIDPSDIKTVCFFVLFDKLAT